MTQKRMSHSKLPPDSFLRALRYDATYCLTAMPMALAFSLRSEGSRHVPLCGPALLIANHQSFFDPLLVGLASRRRLCYLARKTLYTNPAFAWIIRGLNAVPIDQEGVGKEGLRTTLDMLNAGRAVLVFPEGERTHDGVIQELKPGVQLLLKRTAAQVIPVGIAGAYDAWPRWRKYPLAAPLFFPPRRGAIAVSIGRPIAPARLEGLSREQLLHVLFDEIHAVATRAERLRRK
jgi:1-acyl-sn-glycerol-3-phosphate acyltransferase